MTQYIADNEHFSEVIARIANVRHSLVIGTADIKDLYVKVGAESKPFLAVLDSLVKRGVEVRLLHAKEPGPNFCDDFDKYPLLIKRLKRKLCPRVHFKIIVFDCEMAYIGSANLTGAGIGMKSDGKRNFEAGILTTDLNLADSAGDHFNAVWSGEFCKECKRKSFCSDRIK
jgi:phosphatidylserine/phosphatidylglycerophosphate/cardiolipin synthase-like enzyme